MIIKEENPCVDVGLHLALGLGVGGGGGGIPSGGGGINKKRPRQQAPAPVQFHVLFPSSRPKKERSDDGDDEAACVPRDRHTGGALSRLSLSPTVTAEEEEDSVDKDPRTVDSGSGGTRKKLRLSKDQSALLEDSFRQQSTLNPAQKQELAQRLNLRPRQVEVWFQNRRARTKLKQTEVDCELLKKWCENLSDENRRLKRELQELRSMRTGNHHHHPFFLRLQKPAAAGSPTAATVCPSCERVATPGGSSSSSSLAVAGGGTVLSVAAAASSPKFYSCAAAIKDSSVACCK